MKGDMTTPKQIERNRRNARHSTGPRTPAGKAKSSRNATKHGALSASPVIPFLEKPSAWQSHEEAFLRALAPQGALETFMADRIALLAWRLGRVARYERERIAVGQERIETDLRDERILRASLEPRQGIRPSPSPYPEDVKLEARLLRETRRALDDLSKEGPDEKRVGGERALSALFAIERVANRPEEDGNSEVEHPDPNAPRINVEMMCFPEVPDDVPLATLGGWEGWTRGIIREAVAAIAREAGRSADDLVVTAREEARYEESLAALEARNVEAEINRRRRLALLPPADTLEKVTRYEAHLERSLIRSLHELQRLQARRTGGPAPAALDVELAITSGDNRG